MHPAVNLLVCSLGKLTQLEYRVCCCPNHSKTVIDRLERIQKTAAEMVRPGVWKHSIMKMKWKTYSGSTYIMDKKEHVNSNAHMKMVLMKNTGRTFY